MPKLDQKSSSRSTSSSDRSSQSRGVRVEQMLNILSQNYADNFAIKKRRFSQESNSSGRKKSNRPFQEAASSDEPSKRFQSFMEKKANMKKKFLEASTTNPQSGEFKTESPRKEKQKQSSPRKSKQLNRMRKNLSFLERMMLEESAKREISQDAFDDSFQQIISISQRDVKLNINNFCVFRSPHCSHSNSCLNNLFSSTITTGLKSMTVTFLGSFFSKYLFPKLKMSAQIPFQVGLLASLINLCSTLSSCVLKGILNKSSPLFPVIVFSSWGLLIFKKGTRKTIAILSLTLCIDILLRKYVYTQQNKQCQESTLQMLKRRLKSKRMWLQMLLFAALTSLSTMVSTHFGIVARKKLDAFGNIMRTALGWK